MSYSICNDSIAILQEIHSVICAKAEIWVEDLTHTLAITSCVHFSDASARIILSNVIIRLERPHFRGIYSSRTYKCSTDRMASKVLFK